MYKGVFKKQFFDARMKDDLTKSVISIERVLNGKTFNRKEKPCKTFDEALVWLLILDVL